MGLEAVINWLLSIWRFITPCHWLYPWEGGVRMHRWVWTWKPWKWLSGDQVTELQSGIHFKVPGIQRIHQTVTASQPCNLPPQSATLADGTKLNVSGVVLYSIKSCVWFFTRIHDQDDYILNVAIRSVGQVLSKLNREEVVGKNQEAAELLVLDQIKKNLRGKGYDVEAFGFSDLQEGKALRILFGEGKSNYLPSDL